MSLNPQCFIIDYDEWQIIFHQEHVHLQLDGTNINFYSKYRGNTYLMDEHLYKHMIQNKKSFPFNNIALTLCSFISALIFLFRVCIIVLIHEAILSYFEKKFRTKLMVLEIYTILFLPFTPCLLESKHYCVSYAALNHS